MAGETPNPIELRIIDLYPHNDSSDVALDQNLNLHFNSNVNIESGNIYIVKHDDDTNYEEISVGSDQVTGDGTSKITIQPVNNFESNTRYYILADENSFSTDAGSGFAGITSKKYWSFTSKDVESPDVFLESNENNPTNAEAFKLIIRFSEKVTGFTMDDLVASNASLDNLEMIEADSVWSSDVFPVTDGRVTINMASDMVTDAAGNGNNSAAEFNIYYDATRPSVSISSSNDTIVEAQFNVSIDFSERVLGFQSPAIHIENGEINSFSTNDSISFLAIARAETPGNIMIHIAENQTVDSAGNPNTSSNELKTTYIISTSVDIMKKQGVSMYSNEGFLIIHFLNDKLTNFNSAFIEIYNLNGSLVKKEKIINNARYKTFLGSKKTVYIVKLTLGNQVYYAKIYF